MKITKEDIGRKAITRDGEIVVIDAFDNSDNKPYPVNAGQNTYNEEGEMFYKGESIHDLMKWAEGNEVRINITSKDVGETVKLRNGRESVIEEFVEDSKYPVKTDYGSFTAEGNFLGFDESDERDIISFVVNETVNSESHYDKGVPTIKIMKEKFGEEAVENFALLNAFKYLARCEHKGQKESDIFKAENYLHYYRTGEWIK